ncbi:MAG TPA: BREX system ATP-binding domain-containing protein [Streptosporangiaceae bacterium]|nr:BREX system ATP-binding domain-containing protein [Streptosporangiaceae bacterium]
MLCPVLIGREAEVSALSAALARTSDGSGGMFFITGEAGVGKTRLSREAVEIADSRGFYVLSGRAVESAIPVPFRPVTEALMRAARAGVVLDGPEMANYRPALGSLVPEWGQPSDSEAEVSPIILGEALIRLLTRLGPGGALLVLEDLHWADPETLAIVEYLAGGLAGTHILCVVTVRDTEPSPGLTVMRAIGARRDAVSAELRRLPDRAVRQMAVATLGTEELPGELPGLLADCDGLPFAVEEMLAAAVSSGQLVLETAGWQIRDHVRTKVPASIVGSVRDRLANLDPAVADILSCAALLGRQFDWTLLPGTCCKDESKVLAALRQAQDVQLIDPVAGNDTFRFRHSLTRNAILSDLLAPDLARRSAGAAASIEAAHPDLPGAWCELAAELHEAAGDGHRAAELMLKAGKRAFDTGALSTSAKALRDARDLVTALKSADPALAIDIGEALVMTLALTGNYDELAPVADQLIDALDTGEDNLRRQARILLTAARAGSEASPVEAAQYLAKARALEDRIRVPVTSAWTDAVAARCAIDAGDLDQAAELAHRALARAQAAGMRGWAADVAFEAFEIIGREERVRDIRSAQDAFEHAYQIAAGSGAPFAVRRIKALHELGTVQMLDEGSGSLLWKARELATQAGALSTTITIDLQLAHVASGGTDLDGALDAARRCEEEAASLKMTRSQAMAVGVEAFIWGVHGDRRAAVRAAGRAEAIAPDDPQILAYTWGGARVTAAIFTDNLPRATAECETAIGYARDIPFTSAFLVWGYWSLLGAVSGEGAQALAEARAAGAQVARINRGCLAYAEAVLAGKDGDVTRAGELARQGDEQLDPYAPWWSQVIRRIVAPAAISDGWGDPETWLRDAARDFDASGHARLASACRGILRRAGMRVPRAGRGIAQVPMQMRRLGITSREMDVLLLVAQGYSNTEIASMLFISPKTVETHVASLVTKTGQSGKRALVAHSARILHV